MNSYSLLLQVAAGGELGIPECQLTPESVKQLTGCGVLQVEQDLRDRRFMVVLTEKGRSMLSRSHRQHT